MIYMDIAMVNYATGFFLLGMQHFAHLVSGLDIENDTPHDSLGSHLVDGTNHHSHHCHRFLVDDDLGIL